MFFKKGNNNLFQIVTICNFIPITILMVFSSVFLKIYVATAKKFFQLIKDIFILFNDRGKKFQYYRTIPSLQEYILISSQEYLIECFRRTKNDLWTLQTYEGLDAILRIENLAIDAPLSEIYATLSFDPVSDIQPENDRS